MGNKGIGIVCYDDDAACNNRQIRKRPTEIGLPVLSSKPPYQYEYLYQKNQMHDNHESTAQMQGRGGGQTHG